MLFGRHILCEYHEITPKSEVCSMLIEKALRHSKKVGRLHADEGALTVVDKVDCDPGRVGSTQLRHDMDLDDLRRWGSAHNSYRIKKGYVEYTHRQRCSADRRDDSEEETDEDRTDTHDG